MGAEQEIFGYADELGPEKVVHFYDPKLQLKGILVVDNTALGPAIGGIRWAPDITTNEIFRLARSMTLKNSAAGISYGGGKAGIRGNPDVPNREEFIRAFARFLRVHTDYIPGPDMGTDEHCMAIIQDEIGRAIGLHRELGGIPLDEMGVTGYGAGEAAEEAADFIGLDLKGATVAIEGFGAVGQACFRSLVSKGARVVAVSDIDGAIYDPEGMDFDALVQYDKATKKVSKLWNRDYKRGRHIADGELFGLDVDVLVPGARPDVITMKNVESVKARLVVEAANIPASLEAERFLGDKGSLVVPDFIANGGGVIAGSVELRKGTIEESFKVIKKQIRENVSEIMALSKAEALYPREAAERIARRRVMVAMKDKGRL
ncbi:MAG: Glu/Leu/Phe/Val dehydrogenase [Dehalococcoidia bacterium]|nr:Glu/Leu/Phe/Val dehydrogenase [Dehalococcoidia bacterium]